MKTAKDVTQNDIAVIAGYAAQVTHMETILQQEGLKDVATGTIDKWQGGGEEDCHHINGQNMYATEGPVHR